jgi:predicted aconitase
MSNRFYYIRATTINDTQLLDATPYASIAEAHKAAKTLHEKSQNAYKDVWVEDSDGARIIASVKCFV